METAAGTLMIGIFALVSLPMAIGLMIWGLASDSTTVEATPVAYGRYPKQNDRKGLPLAA